MLNIYLARHGQDEDNANDILNGQRDTKLTQIGIKQAQQLANKIKKSNILFNKIYSSPLQRAYKTAEIISNSLNYPPPEKLDLLIERDFGIMTGKEKNDIKKLCSPHIFETEAITYFLKPDGAETFPDLLKRAQKLLSYIKNNYQNGNILLVTHGDLGKMLYCDYYNLIWQDVLSQFHFGNSDLLLLSKDSHSSGSHLIKLKQYNS